MFRPKGVLCGHGGFSEWSCNFIQRTLFPHCQFDPTSCDLNRGGKNVFFSDASKSEEQDQSPVSEGRHEPHVVHRWRSHAPNIQRTKVWRRPTKKTLITDKQREVSSKLFHGCDAESDLRTVMDTAHTFCQKHNETSVQLLRTCSHTDTFNKHVSTTFTQTLQPHLLSHTNTCFFRRFKLNCQFYCINL